MKKIVLNLKFKIQEKTNLRAQTKCSTKLANASVSLPLYPYLPLYLYLRSHSYLRSNCFFFAALALLLLLCISIIIYPPLFFFFFVEAAWNERFVELGHLCAVPANCCCVCFKYFFRCLLPRFLGFLSMQKDWQKIAVSFFLASFLRVSVNVKGNNLFLSWIFCSANCLGKYFD